MVVLGDEAFEGGEAVGDFLEERGIVGDEDEVGVLLPELAESEVEGDGFVVGFRAGGIAAFDAHAAGGGGFEEDDGVVAGEFLCGSGAEAAEEAFWFAGPVGGSVDGAAVAEEDAVRVAGVLNVFEVALDLIDGALGGFDGEPCSASGEAT